ncbi:uncharacterized protein LOC128553645 [Mercenaria mercenaria]|uniref:uncharacterized protein LOC128553645 n=1 Tax=Mercenaria mercenaria TaxID=6596 RepID=UPI00234E58A1|nr:uncharacterized protein LOC128553645 [Mercenaria mercenaria]
MITGLAIILNTHKETFRTHSYYRHSLLTVRFGMIDNTPIPPRIIVITDGKATGVNDIIEFDEEPHEDSTRVRQQIIEEISAILKEEIEVHFVYVGDPDIVFLHKLQEITGGELVPYTSGRTMAKYIAFKCMLQHDKASLARKEEKQKKREHKGTKDDKEAKGGKGKETLEKGVPLSSRPPAAIMAKIQRRMLKRLLGSTDRSIDSDSSDSSDDSDIETEREHFPEFLRKKHGLPEMPNRLDLEKFMRDHMTTMGQDFYKENTEMQKYAPIGSRVKRGRDWRWGNQDKGGPGTIIGHSYDELKKYWCWVEWDANGDINAYRWNMNGKCDLTIVEEERVPNEGKILAVGSRIKPGDAFKGDKLHEEGIVIKLIDDVKVQVRWANDGSREELAFGKDGSPTEIVPVTIKGEICNLLKNFEEKHIEY